MRIAPLILAALLLSGTAAAAQTQPPFATIFCVMHAVYCQASKPSLVDFAEAQKVNGDVNWQFRQDGSDASFRQPWRIMTKPGETGSCHDFAVTKMARLVADGVPAGALALGYLHVAGDPDGLDHLVLLVNTSIGIYVLDNLSPLMWRVDQETRYHWISRQVFGSPREWVSMERTP